MLMRRGLLRRLFLLPLHVLVLTNIPLPHTLLAVIHSVGQFRTQGRESLSRHMRMQPS